MGKTRCWRRKGDFGNGTDPGWDMEDELRGENGMKYWRYNSINGYANMDRMDGVYARAI